MRCNLPTTGASFIATSSRKPAARQSRPGEGRRFRYRQNARHGQHQRQCWRTRRTGKRHADRRWNTWYSAPEQKTDPQRVDSRADIYSLGVVFYEMLTGELPRKPSNHRPIKFKSTCAWMKWCCARWKRNPNSVIQQVSEVKTMVETIMATDHGPIVPPAHSRPPLKHVHIRRQEHGQNHSNTTNNKNLPQWNADVDQYEHWRCHRSSSGRCH